MSTSPFAGIPDALADSLLGEGPRRKILEGTARVVARKGCQDITVQELLDASDVARRTFYRAFRTKDEPLLVLFEAATGILLFLLEAAATGEGTPQERLERTVEAYLDLQLRGGALLAELQKEALRPDSLLAPRREEVLQRLIEVSNTTFEDYAGRPIDPFVVRTLLLGMEGLMIHLWRDGALSSTQRDRALRALVAIVLRTIAAPGVTLPELPGP